MKVTQTTNQKMVYIPPYTSSILINTERLFLASGKIEKLDEEDPYENYDPFNF